MTTYRDALEAYNRETHSDALPELMLVPAETVQPLPLEGASVPLWVYAGVGLLFALMVSL